MNKFNSYLDIHRAKDQVKKEIKTKYIKLANPKNLEASQYYIDNLKIIFPQININKRKINIINHKKVNPRLSDDIERQINPNYNLKKENFNAKTHDVYYNEKTDANVSMISLYDGTQKKINIHKFNSITYIKKRPNDLIKNQNLNRSTISKYSNNTIKIKGKCLSCTNLKNINDIVKDISNFQSTATAKNIHFQKVHPFNINNFTFKDRENALNNLSSIVSKIVKRIITSKKVFFMKIMKKHINTKIHNINQDEYKLLEELKSLGVTNKKELNLLLKDIYLEIKGKN